MTPKLFTDIALAPALSLLPPKMDTPAARALIVAICLQESRLTHRRQINGSARGFAQFEPTGVRGVLQHAATKPHILSVLDKLEYPASADTMTCYVAIEHNDILAAAFARLLLWTLPASLPVRGQSDAGWQQYTEAWRPGRPHRETFDAIFEQAWGAVTA